MGGGTYETSVCTLYFQLLEAWNRASGDDFASHFADDGETVGFDGNELSGRPAIARELGRIFADHDAGDYVGMVRNVRRVGPQAAILHAVAGMVPPGEEDVDPKLNAVQVLVAEKRAGEWKVVLYQSTPVRFHGRPELDERLTQELREELKARA
jgi:uncharacterized protein (TIGR02246 family)